MRVWKDGTPCLATVVTFRPQKQVAERDGAGEDGEDPAVVVVALPGRPGEPLLALCALPQLLVYDGVDGGDGGVLLLEQKKSQLGLEKHQ